MNTRTIAKVTGWSLVAMAIIAGISLGYAYDKAQSEFVQHAENSITLFKVVLFGILLTVILDFTVSFTLYKFFEKDNRVISLTSAVFRVIYTLIFGVAATSLISNLSIWTTNPTLIVANFAKFQFIWHGGLIIFGVHLVLIGFLMSIHQKIPKILWVLTVIAGLSYSIINFLKVVTPSLEQLTQSLEMILMLPMIVGELGLAIWLIIKGGNASR
jgi:hypothetical protein